jgi:hypothetical protein
MQCLSTPLSTDPELPLLGSAEDDTVADDEPPRSWSLAAETEEAAAMLNTLTAVRSTDGLDLAVVLIDDDEVLDMLSESQSLVWVVGTTVSADELVDAATAAVFETLVAAEAAAAAAAAAAACMAAERLGGTKCCNGAGIGLLPPGVRFAVAAAIGVGGAATDACADTVAADEMDNEPEAGATGLGGGDKEGGGEVGDWPPAAMADSADAVAGIGVFLGVFNEESTAAVLPADFARHFPGGA